MPTYLARWIIKEYSHIGDNVLDPMAGIGTTIIESSILGRNGIGIEYEKKFVDMINENIRKSSRYSKAQAFLGGQKRGEMRVIHGDSRFLSQFISGRFIMEIDIATLDKEDWYVKDTKTGESIPPNADLVAFSPPFYATHSGQKPSGIAIDPKAHGHQGIAIPDYTDNKDNIDRLKDYGKNLLEYVENTKFSPLCGWSAELEDDGYDLVISSPTYSQMNQRGGLEVHKDPIFRERMQSNFSAYSPIEDDLGQIGNLKKHGDITLIASSPPYGEGLGHPAKIGREGGSMGLQMNQKYVAQFSEDNIASLPHGLIDAVVCSPPYGHQSYTEKDHKKTKWREENEFKIGHEKSDWYGDTLGNIGLIPHNKDIDSIITSPPYGHQGSVYSKMNQDVVNNNPNMKGRKAFAEEAAEPYSANTNNIGSQQGETYLEAMLKVYKGCYQVLRENGYMALVTKNFVKGGEEVRLDLDTIKLCELAGFKFVDHYYHKLNQLSFWQILHKKRCSNLRLTTKSKLLRDGKRSIAYTYSDKSPAWIESWNDDLQVPVCQWEGGCVLCPFSINEQKDCKEYFNKYPKIEHEDVLIFQKIKERPIDVM